MVFHGVGEVEKGRVSIDLVPGGLEQRVCLIGVGGDDVVVGMTQMLTPSIRRV